MFAWRAAGVALPHNAAAQYRLLPHIPISQLQPGDLVFTRGLGHVGMYIGNGKMVHAPHHGVPVMIAATETYGAARVP